MEVAQLQSLVDEWEADFFRRFPARITATGLLRVNLLRLLFSLDSIRRQRFVQGAGGQPAFRLVDVAKALGLSPRNAYNGAMASSLVVPHVSWVSFAPGLSSEPALSLGGVVALVAVIPPGRYRSLTQQRAHQHRRSVAVDIIRMMPANQPDVGAAVNEFVTPLAEAYRVVH